MAMLESGGAVAGMRVVFMGTPEFSVGALESLHRAFRVVGVYTQPDKPVGRGMELRPTPVKAKALELGLPVFQPERLSASGELERLAALQPDVIVVAAYAQLLKRDVLELPRLGCVNLHTSLLPRWRGAAPIQWALLAGDAESGLTVMRMAEGLDTGDILLQERCAIGPRETAGTLHDRLAAMGARLGVEAVRGLAEGHLRGRPQGDDGVTYAKKLSKEMQWLDCARASAELDRQVRALSPWPGTSIRLESGERLRVLEAAPARGTQRGAHAGTVFLNAGVPCLGTADGALELLRVQWDGKKPVSAAEFLNGLRGRGKELPLRVASGPGP